MTGEPQTPDSEAPSPEPAGAPSGQGPAERTPARNPALRVFGRLWGASPWHLVGHLLLVAVAAYALSVMFEERFAPRPWNLVLWLLGGAVLHDAVFLPAYSAVNLAVARLVGVGGADARRIRIFNHVRVPLVISGILLLVFSPRIFNGQPQNFERALGHAPPDYLGRWLAVTAALLAGSAAWYAIGAVRGGRATPDSAAAPDAADASR